MMAHERTAMHQLFRHAVEGELARHAEHTTLHTMDEIEGAGEVPEAIKNAYAIIAPTNSTKRCQRCWEHDDTKLRSRQPVCNHRLVVTCDACEKSYFATCIFCGECDWK